MATPEEVQMALKFKGEFFQRPGHVKIPTVWLRFEGKTRREDGTYPKFRIEDVTEDSIEEIIQCLPIFNDDILLGKALTNLGLKEVQLRNFENLWRLMIEDRVSLQCVTDDEETPRLVGFNVNEIATHIKTVDGMESGIKVMDSISDACCVMRQEINVFERWNVDKYLDAWGLFVKPEFRGQRVAYYLLEARKPLCKALGVKATANGFGSHVATRVAQHVGFEMLYEITFPKIEEKYDIKLPGGEEGSFTFLGMKLE